MNWILLLLSVGRAMFAQDMAPKAGIERDRALRRSFETALVHDPDSALPSLPLVIDRPWIGEVSFHDACALARAAAHQPAGALAGRLVLATGLHNPELALRESGDYLPLENGTRLFERFVLAAPGEAMALAAGSSQSAQSLRELISGAGPPEFPLLLRLAEDSSIDLPRRRRVAVLAGRIVRGQLSFESALRIAGDTPRFFAEVLDMRTAKGADAEPLDRVLENESLVLCRAAQENLNLTLANDLARFRARDLYALLSLGRAEATPEFFAAAFDRLLLKKWMAETPTARSLLDLLDQTGNWGLRDFAAGALAAHRFDRLLSVAGKELIPRLAGGIDRSGDPLKEGMRLAEIVDATTAAASVGQMRSIVSAEWTRCSAKGDWSCATIYGLLAAKLGLDGIGDPYRPFFESSETLDTALLFGDANDCIQRHFFYDDDDGVKSFESFLRSYEHDPAWEVEDLGAYVHLTGRGPAGRRIEIFANVPIDGHLPRNRGLEGEAQRRQQAISEALQKRGLAPTVIVHRGHAFWTERTLGYVQKTARLVILGSCGGSYEVHRVIEASHESQVIATRGVGATEINDTLLKAVNDRILTGERVIQWSQFWRELGELCGKSGIFRDYVGPHQDPGIVFLRAYYRFLDAR